MFMWKFMQRMRDSYLNTFLISAMYMLIHFGQQSLETKEGINGLEVLFPLSPKKERDCIIVFSNITCWCFLSCITSSLQAGKTILCGSWIKVLGVFNQSCLSCRESRCYHPTTESPKTAAVQQIFTCCFSEWSFLPRSQLCKKADVWCSQPQDNESITMIIYLVVLFSSITHYFEELLKNLNSC